MAMNVHLAAHGEALGIVPIDEFLVGVKSGDYAPETLAWTEGEEGWVTLSEFVAKHASRTDQSVFLTTPKEIGQSGVRAARHFFPELGADIETYVRTCVGMPQRDWVRWDDGREEHFPLPVAVSAGQTVIMLGVRSIPRAGLTPATNRDGEALFSVPGDVAHCWCIVENIATKARWSELAVWLDRFVNEAGRSAIESAKIRGFDLEKAATNESSKPFYLGAVVLLPTLVAVGLGVFAWWGASFVVANPVSVVLGAVVGTAIFIYDLRANIKNGMFNYGRVQTSRVKGVQDGITVRSTMKKLEKFVLESFAGG